MARQRRSGFKTPELRGTLGTLLRTTLQQAGVVRDAIERGAREGRSRLDEARAGRRRQDALADLGELVLDLIRRGEIDLGELPEARTLVRTLDELDADGDGAAEDPDAIAQPPSRRRFDDRSRDEAASDGTVSSARWSPPAAAAGTTAKRKPDARVWRPTAPEVKDVEEAAPPVAVAPPARKSGIRFAKDDDDSDLADYMHPDDVPPKAPDR